MHSNSNVKDGMQSPDSDSPSTMKNQMNTPATGASIGHFNHMITALQDNQGKNIKRKSVMVHNFYKTFKESSETNNDATNSTQNATMGGGSRKFSKENMILKMFKIMKEKS
jgi:hypothetical protein